MILGSAFITVMVRFRDGVIAFFIIIMFFYDSCCTNLYEEPPLKTHFLIRMENFVKHYCLHITPKFYFTFTPRKLEEMGLSRGNAQFTAQDRPRWEKLSALCLTTQVLKRTK